MKLGLYNVDEINSIAELLQNSALKYGENAAFHLKDADGNIYPVSYNELNNRVAALSAALIEKGFLDAPIAVMGENRFEWATSYLAATCFVGLAVPIDKDLQTGDIENILRSSDAKVLIFSGKYSDKIDIVAPKFPNVTFIDMDKKESSGDILSYDILVNNGATLIENGDNRYLDTKKKRDDIAAIVYTSGTTGVMKGVVLSHYNICYDIMATIGSVEIRDDDKAISILPLHHTYECSLGFLAMIYCGASICFSGGLRTLANDFKQYAPTVMVTVPLLLENVHAKIMKKVAAKKRGSATIAAGKTISTVADFIGLAHVRRQIFDEIHQNFGGKIRKIFVGAAAMSPEIVKDYHDFGFKLYLGYGLTETSPLAIGNNDAHITKDSVGLPLPGVSIKLLNKNELGVGEIAIKGPIVMQGYYNDKAATDAVFEDGYFKSGDLATLTSKGYYKIVGRIKNVIVTKTGKNIYPEELEYYINQSPFVRESLVLGTENTGGDTKIFAQIIIDDENIQSKLEKDGVFDPQKIAEEAKKVVSDLIHNINAKLPNYKSIRDFVIRDKEFDKTTTQKIKRFSDENKVTEE